MPTPPRVKCGTRSNLPKKLQPSLQVTWKSKGKERLYRKNLMYTVYMLIGVTVVFSLETWTKTHLHFSTNPSTMAQGSCWSKGKGKKFLLTGKNLPGFFGAKKPIQKKTSLIFIWISPAFFPKKYIGSAHPSHDICYPSPYTSLCAARVNLERRVLYSRRKVTMEASAPVKGRRVWLVVGWGRRC